MICLANVQTRRIRDISHGSGSAPSQGWGDRPEDRPLFQSVRAEQRFFTTERRDDGQRTSTGRCRRIPRRSIPSGRGRWGAEIGFRLFRRRYRCQMPPVRPRFGAMNDDAAELEIEPVAPHSVDVGWMLGTIRGPGRKPPSWAASRTWVQMERSARGSHPAAVGSLAAWYRSVSTGATSKT